jgi:hypothetical protein
MKFAFITLTSPERQFHNVDAVVKWIQNRNPEKWKVISEMGTSGDNPHLHLLFSLGTSRIDNIKEPLCRQYYGAKLASFQTTAGFTKHGYNAKTVNGLIQFSNVCVYINKDIPEYDYGNIDLAEETKGRLTFEEHCEIENKHKTVVYTMDQLLLMATEEYYIYCASFQTSLEKHMGRPVNVRPPDKEDFKEIIKILHKKEVNLMNLYKNMKPFYINWLAQLGNYMAMERFIDKIDDDLNIRN